MNFIFIRNMNSVLLLGFIFVHVLEFSCKVIEDVNLVSKIPRVTLKAPFEDTLTLNESSELPGSQVLVFNKTLVRLELQCTFHTPVTWEFNFDPYVYHWTDAFWTRSHRSFERFTEPSSYSYTSVLKIRFHDPIPIPQTFTCLELPSNDFQEIPSAKLSFKNKTLVFLDSDEESTASNFTVTFRIQSPNWTHPAGNEDQNNSTRPIDSETEKPCEVTFWIKNLAVGKLQWKCVTKKNNASQKISYRHNWYCTTADQCRNYYVRAKDRKTCVKRLSSSDECPNCITYSGFASFLLFCKTNNNSDHWTLPISYTVNTELTLPKQKDGWNFTQSDNENLVYFKPIPSMLIRGDEILLECHASEFVFSTSMVFALKYLNSSRLEYLEDSSKFTFKYSPQSQTYTSYYEDETRNSSFYNIPTNTRIYRKILKIEDKHWEWNGGLEEIFCYAPVRNEERWISKSQKVVKLSRWHEQHTDQSYFRLGNDNPKVVILPIYPSGYFSVEDTLVLEENTENLNWSVKLNCSHHQPIEWIIVKKNTKEKLQFKQELRRKIPSNETGLQNSIFLSSVEFTGSFRAQESFSITCFVSSNRVANARVTFNISTNYKGSRTRSLLSVRVSPFPSIDGGEGGMRFRKETKKGDCVTIFIVKEVNPSVGRLEWKCVDGQQPIEQMNDVSEIECNDYLTCKILTQDDLVQDPARCLKVLNSNESCDNCDSGLITANKRRYDFTRYLRCEHPLKGITYQPVFKPLKSDIPEIWYQISSYEKMLKLEEAPGGILYLHQNYTIKCSASPYVFSRGLRISLTFEGQTDNSVFMTGREDIFTATNQIVISVEIEINYLNLREITCFAPLAFSSEFINTSSSLRVVDSSPPIIRENAEGEVTVSGVVGDLSTAIVCEAFGIPAPDLQWTFPSEVSKSQSAMKSIIVESHRMNTTILTFKPVLEIHSGTYECVATNLVGTTRKLFYFQPQLEGAHNYHHNGIVIGLISLAILMTIVALYIYWKCWRLRKAVEVLTQLEIDEFFKGVPESEAKLDQNIPNHEVYCQPFNGALKILRSNIKFDSSRILGEGAFGVVCVGYLTKDPATEIAVKLVKPTAKVETFKTLLAEIKVMAFVGEHENLVKFLGACTSNIQNKEVVIALEFCCNGSLKNYLCSNRNCFEVALRLSKQVSSSDNQEYENMKPTGSNEYTNWSNNDTTDYANSSTSSHSLGQLLKWSAELANGCEFLESKRVVHGDIAARNVLLNQNLTAKLSDFGLSRVISEYSNYARSPADCPLPWKWLSPESLTDKKFSSKSDVWAFGVTLWEIFSLGEIPYPGMSYTTEFVELLKNGLRPVKPQAATEDIVECLQKCWAPTADERPSFADIKKDYSKILGKAVLP